MRRSRIGKPKVRLASNGDTQLDVLFNVRAQGSRLEAERDHSFFEPMLKTGILVSTAVNLDVRDADLAAAEITMRCKGDRIERVYASAEFVEHLRAWVGDRSNGPLFATRHGGRLTTRQVARRLGQWVERAGIKRAASPHALRHSFATGLYARTHDVLLVKEALRHRSVASTLVYARVDAQRLKRAMACSTTSPSDPDSTSPNGLPGRRRRRRRRGNSQGCRTEGVGACGEETELGTGQPARVFG